MMIPPITPQNQREDVVPPIALCGSRSRLRRGWNALAAGALTACVAMVATAPVLASVRTLPTAATGTIDRNALHAEQPQLQSPGNPAMEKILQNLRTTAQSERNISPRKQRPPSARTPSELSPPDAAWLLGLLALHGLAMPTDPPQAQLWFERAQMLGHPLAPAGLAWCQITGCVNPPNPAGALHWIAVLRRNQPGLAKYLQWHAAKALAPLPETPSSQSPSAAPPAVSAAKPSSLRQLLEDAARSGNAQARNELGLDYLTTNELDKALAQFNAASAGSEAARANAILLSDRIKTSAGGAQAPLARNSANDWYLQARRYHRGEGVPANYTEAVRLYQIAASSGDPQAKKMLGLIFSRPLQGGAIDIGWMQQLANINVSASGSPQNVGGTEAPSGWQRDPSPLFDLVPMEWRTATPLRRP